MSLTSLTLLLLIPPQHLLVSFPHPLTHVPTPVQIEALTPTLSSPAPVQ